jgi:hypothetical protein
MRGPPEVHEGPPEDQGGFPEDQGGYQRIKGVTKGPRGLPEDQEGPPEYQEGPPEDQDGTKTTAFREQEGPAETTRDQQVTTRINRGIRRTYIGQEGALSVKMDYRKLTTGTGTV